MSILPSLKRVALMGRAAALATAVLCAALSARAADCDVPVFFTAPEYAVGLRPQAVASGDFNGDSVTDLAVANRLTHDITILLGDGAGGFGPATNFAALEEPQSIAVGDFNKDGRADLAVGHAFTGKVAVLFGDGAGRFSAASLVATFSAHATVAAGDFNADTKPDIAVGLAEQNPRVLLGDGAGHFAVRNVAVGSDSGLVTTGEFNGDGVTDLAFAVRSFPNEVVVVPGSGSGNFAAGARMNVDHMPKALATGHFNGDGRSDIVVAIEQPFTQSGAKLVTFLNQGAGTFGGPRQQTADDDPSALAVGDFTGDGKTDIALASADANSVQIFNGFGNGIFTAALAQHLTGRTPSALVAADFNADGKPDLAAANANAHERGLAVDLPGSVSVLLGRGAGLFDAARSYKAFTIPPRAVAVADFNNNGRADAAALYDGTSTIAVTLDDGAGGLLPPAGAPYGGQDPMAIAAADFNGDARPDLAVINKVENTLYIIDNDGSGGFPSSRGIPVGVAPSSVAVGDFNGDGKTDLVVGHDDTGKLTVMLGNGAGVFAAAPGSPFNAPSRPAVGDFNGDGRSDLAVAHRPVGSFAILLSDSAGRMTTASTNPLPSGDASALIAAGDFNADGDTDVVTTNIMNDGVSLFLGDGTGHVSAGVGFSAGRSTPQAITVGDFDGDGASDVVTGNNNFQGVAVMAVLAGNSVGGLDAPRLYTAGGIPVTFGLGDFNGDAKVDLLVAAAASDALAILFNTSGTLPCLSVANATVTEGDTGVTNAAFTVTLSEPSAQDVRVSYSLADGTAAAGADYNTVSSRLRFAPGETSKTVNVPVRGDTLDEENETFTLNLSNASGAGIADGEGTGTINDNDPPPALRVGDITVTEGGVSNSWNFTVSLSAPSGRDVTVQYATANGTAVAGTQAAGQDYSAASGTLTIPAGQSSATVAVVVFGDDTFEPDEHFFLNLSNPTNATVLDAQGRASVPNDDPLPTANVADATTNEGDTGARNATFLVRLSNPSARTITFNYATADDTAKAGSDYAAASGVVTFNPGQTEKLINVSVNGDTAAEPDETFFLNLSVPVNATLADARAVGLITDNDASFVQFAAANVSAGEAAGTLSLTVTRTGNLSGASSVRYSTTNQTASDRRDYMAAIGTLRFAAGEGSKTIQLFIVNDRYLEPTESFGVTLGEPSGSSLLGPRGSTVVSIMNDDASTGESPVSWDANFNASFFVRQHYLDFFNREPDAAGLDFWTSQITSCGTDAACLKARRVNVSGAFFLSIEFQETGYLVYLTHQAAFKTAETLPYRTFLSDSHQVSRGVVIGQPGAEARLDANKVVFFNEFVARPAFASAYPATMTPEQFVGALATNAGSSIPFTKRETLINGLASGQLTRAQVLRAIAEDNDFEALHRNRAFVLMQYFGYLRRAPNETPNTDFAGFNFWLGKLNNHNGDFIAAEMVEAFITSAEYLDRFGQ